MLLTQSEFDKRLKDNNLRIALIGMSNIGKSHWARRFKSRHGFHHYEVDDRIQESLSLSSISLSAEWMGHPYQKGYQDRAAEYLALEIELTQKADDQDGNLVLDTTGSIIYLPEETLAQLTDNYLIIYLAARPDDLERLISLFKSSPKPLIWGDHYHLVSGKSNEESMMSLYPSLLVMRDGMYRNLADIELEARYISKKTDLIQLVRDSLPTSQ
ncbi:MAG: hypothetical protein HKO02_09305 [Hyphomonadaceae bacterium]|nr:hypothetical protein [Hyphomonadaceae bacterium]